MQLPAFATNPAAGDLIIVGAANWNSTPARSVLAPTDTAGGNTYTATGAQQTPSASLTMARYRCIVTNGGASFRVTVNMTQTVAEYVGIAELWRHSAGSGISNGDAKVNTQAATANPTSGTTTPAPATDAVFIGFMVNVNAPAIAADGASWNAIANGFNSTMLAASRLTDNVAHQDLFGEYLLSSVAVAATWTEISDNWAVMVASDSPPAGGVAIVPGRPRSRPFPFKPGSPRSSNPPYR